MNNFTLKIIAMVIMLIDHSAVALLAMSDPRYLPMRMVGRIAFPIFCFLLVEGYFHTRSPKKYILRLAAFALISELPFDLALFGGKFELAHQNVFFTLAIGLAVVYGIDTVYKKYASNMAMVNMLQLFIAVAGCLIAILLRTDYTFMGVILIVMFYGFRGKKLQLTIAVLFVTFALGGLIEGLASLSLILIFLYNNEKGPSAKYLMYAFYPVHLLILYLIRVAFLG